MQTTALIIVVAAGLWLVGVGGLMAARPRYSLTLMERMTATLEGSGWRLQITEQGLRIVAGVALIIASPVSKLPLALALAGWALVGSSVMVLLAPIRWHGAYGRWWVERIAPVVVRMASPLPMLAGAGLIYAVL